MIFTYLATRAAAEPSAVTTPTVFPSMDLSLGCMLIGVFMNVFLFGMSVVQGYLYFINFKTDKLFMRAFVAVLLVADTLDCVLKCGFIYQYLVSHFGNLAYATLANPMFTADPVLTGIIAFACQCFFAWRVYRLMHSWWCPILIVITSGASFLSAIGTTIGVSIVLNFTQFQKFQVVVILWLACAAVADMIITIALIWTLQKSRTGFTATDDIITRLIRGTLQTGMATTVFAIADLILFVSSTTALHLVPNLPLAKLYVNSLLSTLNARSIIANANHRAMTQGESSSGGKISGIAFKGGNGASGVGRHAHFTASTTSGLNSPTRRNFFGTKSNNGNSGAGRIGGGGRVDLESGIQVTTIEERFEEPHESTQMASLAHQRPSFHQQSSQQHLLNNAGTPGVASPRVVPATLPGSGGVGAANFHGFEQRPAFGSQQPSATPQYHLPRGNGGTLTRSKNSTSTFDDDDDSDVKPAVVESCSNCAPKPVCNGCNSHQRG